MLHKYKYGDISVHHYKEHNEKGGKTHPDHITTMLPHVYWACVQFKQQLGDLGGELAYCVVIKLGKHISRQDEIQRGP
jgi:hypothetical protein